LEERNQNLIRLLQVLPALNTGGVERGTIDVAKYIAQIGQISFIASASGRLTKELEGTRVKHFELPLKTKNPIKIISNIFALKHIIDVYQINIVHARSRAPAWSAYFACKLTGAKFVTTFHGTYNFKNPLKKFYNSVMQRGEQVIAISDFIKTHIIKNYHTDKNKINLIHRGVDLDDFTPENISAERVQSIKTQFDIIGNPRPIILMPARITRWKGQHLLLKALVEVKHEYVCIFAGSYDGVGSYFKELEQFIKKNNLTTKVKFVGNVADLAAAYKVANIVVNASLEPEAFGRIAIEAGAMHKPIVATKLGAALETIIDNKTGFLVTHLNHFEMANAINNLLNSPNSELERIGNLARKNIEENFSLTKMLENNLNVYNKILQS
jgi:glycosyltransferase involved in cell wall biosynthesis